MARSHLPTMRAARTLALDVATARVVTAFRDAGIPCLLLKGPAMVARLYEHDLSQRSYTDIDLLVPPSRFADAGRALSAIAFAPAAPKSPIPQVGSGRNEETWLQITNPAIIVDLHCGFHGVASQEHFCDIVFANTDVLAVGGSDVAVANGPVCALLVALHAWPGQAAVRPLADLNRALGIFDDATWRQASEMAAACGALPAFTLGLTRQPKGADLVQRLGLSTAAAPDVWLSSASMPEGSYLVTQMLMASGWRRRLELAPRFVFPTTEFMRVWASRHPIGSPPHPPNLPAAYAQRWLRSLKALPATVEVWRSSSRAAAKSGWTPTSSHTRDPDSASSPPRPRRKAPTAMAAALHRPELALRCLPLAAWTGLAWRRVHRQLPTTGLEGHFATGNPPSSPAASEAQGDRVVRAVLQRCGASCLEESIVRQAWLGSRGTPTDIVVGVTSPAEGFKAHAWLDRDGLAPGYVELTRKPFGGDVNPVSP